MNRLLAIISPLIVLLIATFCASLLAYTITLIFGDSVSFRTFFKRSSQLFLVISIFPLMRFLKLSKLELGFAPKTEFFKQFLTGLGIGFITLLPVLMLIFLLDVHLVDESKPWTVGWVSKKVSVEFLLALLISFVEEPIFRGALLTGLSRQFSSTTAIVLSAFYYAALHFVNSNIEIPSHDVEFYSGFILLGDALVQWFNADYISPFFSLFAVGIFLGVFKTHNPAGLGLCIGCHTGWVWQIKLSKHFFNINTQSDFIYLVSSYDGVIGPMVTVWLSFAILAYIFWYRRSANTVQ
ncbi:MAG: CPBP family intramembrane metalloprotease [Methylococcaceae bacterium]|nr:CPBP family intramembrane metalloprotease [Methylococcaceae bacterium]